jgi:hypothetical protein
MAITVRLIDGNDFVEEYRDTDRPDMGRAIRTLRMSNQGKDCFKIRHH